MDALVWMRDNTPEPLGDGDAYYTAPDQVDAARRFHYPPSAYGVMCWWDYGYWVTGVAHRIPNANPTQRGAREAARFYTATDESDALSLLREMGSRYVIVDGGLPMLATGGSPNPTGKFGALARWADKPVEEFFETYHRRNALGQLEPVTLFYPEYFRSMAVRLFLYGDTGFEPRGPFQVARFREVTTTDGRVVKQLDEIQSFGSYREALTFLSDPGHKHARLVSEIATQSCVPLDPLTHLDLVYDAASPRGATTDHDMERVRVFSVREATGDQLPK